MRNQSAATRIVLSHCAAAALMCCSFHAAAQSGGGAPVLLESHSQVKLYSDAHGQSVAATAQPDAFPLKGEKEGARYKVHYNNGIYYVNAMDVSVRQPAKVVCAKAPTKNLASRFGAGSDECK
jgi:hypothetical protein